MGKRRFFKNSHFFRPLSIYLLSSAECAYEDRLRKIAAAANTAYGNVYETALNFYKQNQKGDLETAKLLGVSLPIWQKEYEAPYSDAVQCLDFLSGCKAGDSVMIGDRIDNDIVPANLLGMRTVWIKQGFGQYWSIKNGIEKADYTVDSLSEICEIL